MIVTEELAEGAAKYKLVSSSLFKVCRKTHYTSDYLIIQA